MGNTSTRKRYRTYIYILYSEENSCPFTQTVLADLYLYPNVSVYICRCGAAVQTYSVYIDVTQSNATFKVRLLEQRPPYLRQSVLQPSRVCRQWKRIYVYTLRLFD